jgi:hypothetical protein
MISIEILQQLKFNPLDPKCEHWSCRFNPDTHKLKALMIVEDLDDTDLQAISINAEDYCVPCNILDTYNEIHYNGFGDLIEIKPYALAIVFSEEVKNSFNKSDVIRFRNEEWWEVEQCLSESWDAIPVQDKEGEYVGMAVSMPIDCFISLQIGA